MEKHPNPTTNSVKMPMGKLAKLHRSWLTASPADVRDPGGVGAEPVRDVLPLGRGRVERRPVEEQEVGGGHLAHGRTAGDHVQ